MPQKNPNAPFTPTAPVAVPNTTTTFVPNAPAPAQPFLPPNHTSRDIGPNGVPNSRVPGTGR